MDPLARFYVAFIVLVGLLIVMRFKGPGDPWAH